MGGSGVRWPILDKYDFMQRSGDGNSESEIEQSRNKTAKVVFGFVFPRRVR
jgi:hypothetical protein